MTSFVLLLFILCAIYLGYAWYSGAPWLVSALLWLERSRNHLSSHTLDVSGIQFHYLARPATPPVAGSSSPGKRPVMVLLHGFGGDAYHWLRPVSHLSVHFDLLIPDLPGFGKTPFPPDGAANMEAQADRLHQWMKALDIESCYLAGNSMGAYLAAVYAARYPQQIRALWLLNPGGVHQAELTPLLQTVADGGTNLLIPHDMASFYQLRQRVFARQPWLPHPLVRAIVQRCRERDALYRQLFDAMCYHSAPLESLCPRLTMPVLVVWGHHDQVLHPAGAEVLKPLLPAAQFVLMMDAGHCPMIEFPRRCSEDFVRFVNSSAASLTRSEPAVHY